MILPVPQIWFSSIFLICWLGDEDCEEDLEGEETEVDFSDDEVVEPEQEVKDCNPSYFELHQGLFFSALTHSILCLILK